MLAADDDVGEAEVLAVDGVHHRFLRAAVEHLDVQAQQDHAVGHRLAARAPRAPGRCRRRPARGSRSAPRRCASARRRRRRRPWSRRSADSGRPRRCARPAAASPGRRPGRTRGRGAAGCGSGRPRPAASPFRPAAGGPRGASARTCRTAGPCGCGRTSDRAAQQVRLVGVALEHHVAAGVVGPIGKIDAACRYFALSQG